MVRPWKRRDSFSCVAPALKAHVCCIIWNATGYFNILGMRRPQMDSLHLVKMTVAKDVLTHWQDPTEMQYFLHTYKMYNPVPFSCCAIPACLRANAVQCLCLTLAVLSLVYLHLPFVEMPLNTVWWRSIYLEQSSQKIPGTSVGIHSSETTISQVRQ